MTGSIALDVVIGLVFVFLLYSLFASIIQEIIASLLGLRARNLRHALTRMLLDDKNDETSNVFARALNDAKESWKRNFGTMEDGLLKEFYHQPKIKYLASGRYFSKPSYIHSSDFAKTIIQILKEKGDDALDGEGEDVDVALIDKIQAALAKSGIDDETNKHLGALLEDAQNDLQKFEANLEEWFNNTMDRASGWYKKTTQLNLFLIGSVLAVVFNVNTIAITKTLSKDKEARDAMVQLASKYVEENEELVTLIKQRETKKKVGVGIPKGTIHNKPNTNTTNGTVTNTNNNNLGSDTDAKLRDFEIKLDSLLTINLAIPRK